MSVQDIMASAALIVVSTAVVMQALAGYKLRKDVDELRAELMKGDEDMDKDKTDAAIEGNTFTNYPPHPVAAMRQPAEVVAVLEQAADHAGASASTYRQLAALIRDRPAAAAAVAAGSVDIVKAMRDAYGRGFMVGAQQVQKGGAPYATNDYAAKCRAWIAQYIVRMPMVDTTDIEALRLKLEGALKENAELRQQISDIYNAQNG